MSWFGAFYLAFAGINTAIDNIKKANENNKSKKRAIQNNKDVYFDHNGASRLIRNGEMVSYKQDSMGDKMYVDLEGRVVKKISNPYMEQYIEELNRTLKEHNTDMEYCCRFGDRYPKGIKEWTGWSKPNPKTVILKNSNGQEFFVTTSPRIKSTYFINIKTGERMTFGSYNPNEYRDVLGFANKKEKDSFESHGWHDLSERLECNVF